MRRVRLQHVVYANRLVLPESTPDEFEFDYIDIGSVSRENGIEGVENGIEGVDRLTFGGAPSRARRIVAEGDVIVSTVRTYLKAAASIGSGHEGAVCSTGFAVLTPRPGINPRYLGYLVFDHGFVDEVAARSVGVSYPAISTSELLRIEAPVPSPEEQPLIADFLDRECGRIRDLASALDDLTPALAEAQQRLIDDRFDASTIQLGRVATVQTGLTLGGRYEDGGELVTRPYLRVANVLSDRVVVDGVATVAVPPAVAARTTLRAGDVLMTEGGDIDKLGRGAVWDGPIPGCLHQNHVFAVRCSARLLPEVLAVWTRGSAARRYFESTASRITNIASTNVTKLLRLPVPDLTAHEQAQRLQVFEVERLRLSSAQDEIGVTRSLLTEYQDALITEAVTGKLDVARLSERQMDESAHAAMEGEHPEVLTT